MSSSQAPIRSRRWSQFSVRGMLIFIAFAAVAALFLSMRWNRATNQRRIVKDVLDLGGTIQYDYHKAEANRPNVFDPKALPSTMISYGP